MISIYCTSISVRMYLRKLILFNIPNDHQVRSSKLTLVVGSNVDVKSLFCKVQWLTDIGNLLLKLRAKSWDI